MGKRFQGFVLIFSVQGLPKAILFDLDETLLTAGDRMELVRRAAEEFSESLAPLSPRDIAEAVEEAFLEFWSDEVRHKHWRFRLLDARVLVITEVFRSRSTEFPNLTPELAGRMGERLHALRAPGQARLYEGVLETLDELRRRGVKLALITNGEAAAQREKVDRFDLAKFFDHVQIEGEVGFGKPDEVAYIHAMTVLGVEASDTWMVGDNLEWEVAAPQRLGIFGIWHDPLEKGIPVGSSVKPDRIIHLITDLIPG